MNPDEQKKFVGMNYANMQNPGDFLWHFVERLVRNNTIKWNQAFKGLTYINDKGAIIHNNEPEQICVFNPSIIKIIEQGEVGFNPSGTNTDKKEHWSPVFINIMKAVRGELGGEITWKNKHPTLTFQVGQAKFKIEPPEIESYDGQSLSVNFSYGRADGYYSIKRNTLEQKSMDEIVSQIVNHAKKIAARKSDLMFKPILTIEDAKNFLTKNVISGDNIEYKVKISNPENPEDVKYSRVDVSATTKKEAADIELSTDAFIKDGSENFSLSCYIKINGKTVVNAAPYNDYKLDDLDAAFDELADKLAESLRNYIKMIGPSKYRDSWKTWNDAEQLKYFAGWLAVNCGITLGGRLQERLSDEVSAFKELAAQPAPTKQNRNGEIRTLPSPLEEFEKELSYQIAKISRN